eukprot:CAMPEP_0113625522 /NCGR_PEP_ID=MMETSP0017_2-20120614/13185_1 /TAXON_ID=2856 /ORGANISM="Cylindrotheca closterium" /LENGTH=323 /DNA_ID=CAMNT_0000535643 /DNA_START=190 /DNA_END=1161 /DNA_ORIENTATION=+ /assembly_acc=CAM_ASM_000147
MPVYIHSTFRDEHGRQVFPNGLEWDLDGDSHVRFAVPIFEENAITPEAIVQAYNRWCCAKDFPYKTTEDILSITKQGPDHVNVKWKKGNHVEQVVLGDSIEELLKADEVCTSDDDKTVEVWINGEFQGTLSNNPNDLQAILQKVPKTANKLCYKRTPDRIHIDRYYTSYLRYNQAWDHVWDNLVALEDPKIILNDSYEEDDKNATTIIGTATLNDWIMGGQLTSRMWIQDKGTSILFQRPLYEDDLETSDRKYEISDPKRMEMVRQELTRLQYLAKLRHPYVTQLIANRKAAKKKEQENNKGAEEKKDEEPTKTRKIAQYFGF